MFGNPETTTGGVALSFAATTRVNMRRVKIESGDPIGKEDGVKIRCTVAKNRLAKKNPYTTCEYFAIFGQGIDTLSELPGILEREGVLRKAGSWYYWEDENGQVITYHGLECKFKSKAILVEALRQNPAFATRMQEIVDEIIETGTFTQTQVDAEELKAIKQEEAILNEQASELNLEEEE